jgi:hypothetical protein
MTLLASAVLLAVGLQASVSTEARDGITAPGSPAATELAAGGTFVVEARESGFTGSLTYSPRLLLVQGGSPDFLNSGQLALGYAASRSLRFSLSEAVTYGRQDFSPLAGTGPAPLVAPSVRVIAIVNTTTTLRVEDRLAAGLNGTLAASYSWGGALDAEARGYYPQSRQPGLLANFGWALSAQDALNANLEARTSSSDNGATATFAALTAGLAHTFSRQLQASLATGLSWAEARLDPRAQDVWGLLPDFAGSVSYRPGSGLSFGLRTTVSPALDTLSGTANTNLTVSCEAAWAQPRSLALTAGASWQRVLQGVLVGSESRQAGLRATYPLPAGFELSGGVQIIDLLPVGPGSLAGGLQWQASARVGWAGRTSL